MTAAFGRKGQRRRIRARSCLACVEHPGCGRGARPRGDLTLRDAGADDWPCSWKSLELSGTYWGLAAAGNLPSHGRRTQAHAGNTVQRRRFASSPSMVRAASSMVRGERGFSKTSLTTGPNAVPTSTSISRAVPAVSGPRPEPAASGSAAHVTAAERRSANRGPAAERRPAGSSRRRLRFPSRRAGSQHPHRLPSAMSRRAGQV